MGQEQGRQTGHLHEVLSVSFLGVWKGHLVNVDSLERKVEAEAF